MCLMNKTDVDYEQVYNEVFKLKDDIVLWFILCFYFLNR